MSFDAWLKQVDGCLMRFAGLTHLDLGDQAWRDWYEDRVTASEAACNCLEDEGFPSGEGA